MELQTNYHLTFHLVQIKEFKDAIEGDYFFEMLIDELPMWGYLGEVTAVFQKFHHNSSSFAGCS